MNTAAWAERIPNFNGRASPMPAAAAPFKNCRLVIFMIISSSKCGKFLLIEM
jgi:hypothetical protein